MYLYAFERLDAWKHSRAVVKKIYILTSSFPLYEKFGLADQMRRAVISIASNLAEGNSRRTVPDKRRFLHISYGSTMELVNQLILSNDLKYISDENYLSLRNELSHLANLINKLDKSL